MLGAVKEPESIQYLMTQELESCSHVYLSIGLHHTVLLIITLCCFTQSIDLLTQYQLSNNDDASFEIKINILNEQYFVTIQLTFPEKRKNILPVNYWAGNYETASNVQ